MIPNHRLVTWRLHRSHCFNGVWTCGKTTMFCEIITLGELPSKFKYWNTTTDEEKRAAVPVSSIAITPAEARMLVDLMRTECDPMLELA